MTVGRDPGRVCVSRCVTVFVTLCVCVSRSRCHAVTARRRSLCVCYGVTCVPVCVSLCHPPGPPVARAPSDAARRRVRVGHSALPALEQPVSDENSFSFFVEISSRYPLLIPFQERISQYILRISDSKISQLYPILIYDVQYIPVI